MESILNFSEDLDVNLFDSIVKTALDSSSSEKSKAETVLVKFKEHPNAWTRVDYILTTSSYTPSHFVALQVLETQVKTKWVLFTEEQRNGLKSYVVQSVIKRSEQQDQIILNRFDIILVEILKKDWPRNWPTFISDLITASQNSSMEVCRNSLEILKRLNEEIFMFGEGNITTVRKRMLQNQLKNEFIHIFQLIKTILEYSKKMNITDKLLDTTLYTLQSFSKWMPLQFIVDTEIVELVVSFINTSHSIACLKCLYEIVKRMVNEKVEISSQESKTVDEKILLINFSLIEFLNLYFSKFGSEKLSALYFNLDRMEQDFILSVSFLLSLIYSNKMDLLENKSLKEFLKGLEYLIRITEIEDKKIFVSVLECWSSFVFCLYNEYPYFATSRVSLRRDKYTSILEMLIQALVDKMPRPEEVLVIENEYGEIVKEKLTETEAIDFYKEMKRTIFHLSSLTGERIKSFFIKKLDKQLDGSEWEIKKLNKICWSIGCVSESFSKDEESLFFVDVLKNLLALCEMKVSKDDKAVIASNIMYLVGQYHRFLVSNKRFLKTVVKKLFEFMDETHEGIQDMACDTLLRITNKCPHEFLIQREENDVYISYILKNLCRITKSLEFYQKRIIYECMCVVLQGMNTEMTKKSGVSMNNAEYYKKLEYINLLTSSFSDTNIFQEKIQEKLSELIINRDFVRIVSHVLKSFSLVYKNLPESIITSFQNVFPFLFSMYERLDLIKNGQINSLANKNIILAKQEIIEVFTNVVSVLENLNDKFITKEMKSNFLNNLFQKIIFDYKKSFKDHTLLLLGGECFKSIDFSEEEDAFKSEVFILNTLIEPSIPLILKSEENNDIQTAYYRLLDILIIKRFDSFFPLIFSNSDTFNSIFDSLLYGFICRREISELCLSTILTTFKKCYEINNFLFFQKYFLNTMTNILGIIFDKDKDYGFELQCQILSFLLKICDKLPLFDQTVNNNTFIRNHINELFASTLKNITGESLEIFIVGMFELCRDDDIFREHVFDFRVKVYEYGCNDDLNMEIELVNERKQRIPAGKNII
ncbi:exportin 1 [Hamiltosporidium magnivora]|uniref:Exportin 1 n=1 Tax=Hamiltosporidium magnivora TaxID=148818 RepID=A0A4Q9LIR6_9MICR|nr:exportin 1 [Hamiltosporidium magnivora]